MQDRGQWLLNRVLQTPELTQQFVYQDDEGIWKPGQVNNYMDKISLFMEKLLVLIHISAGQPARSNELLSLCICDARKTRFFSFGPIPTLVQSRVTPPLSHRERPGCSGFDWSHQASSTPPKTTNSGQGQGIKVTYLQSLCTNNQRFFKNSEEAEIFAVSCLVYSIYSRVFKIAG